MSGTSDVNVREARSGLFNIKLDLSKDKKDAAPCRERFKLSGSYSHMGFKMTYDFACHSKKRKVIKQHFTVREIRENILSLGRDNNGDSSENKESEIADNGDGTIINEDSLGWLVTNSLQAETSLLNHQKLPQPGKTVEDLSYAENILGRKNTPPMHVWIYSSGIERTLVLNHDSNVWESKWLSSSKMETISFWIDFGTRTSSESNVISTMNEVAKMFRDQCRCDAEFNFKDERKIGAHILILSAGSRVFAAMFQSNMLESHTRQVIIIDIEIEVFRQLLTHIYTGRAPMLAEENMTQHLYEAADKYGVESLKDDCVYALLNRLRNDNCLNVLVWSHFHSIEKLFESAMIFTVQRFRALCYLQEWAEFMRSFPDLCLQVLQRMAHQIKPCEH